MASEMSVGAIRYCLCKTGTIGNHGYPQNVPGNISNKPTVSTEEAIRWMHAVCRYPIKSTWLKAVKAGNYIGWLLLTERNVNKYYPETTETPKGHMNQTQKNMQSTKLKPTSWEQPTPLKEPDVAQLKGKKVRDVFTPIYEVQETIFSNQTGQFPMQSQSGNKYIMVMVEIDSNAILVEPINSQNDHELALAYKVLMTRLQQAGIIPKKHILDNEVSEATKMIIKDKYKMLMELVPPGCHCRNAAEAVIQNFRAHFLSILAGAAKDFPPSLWDRLLPQTEITLNLLQQSNATPRVSAYAHLCDPINYNKMPLAPMRCTVQVHKKTDKRGTWAYHSINGWYFSTSPKHYRTHRCHIKSTKSERFTDTINFSFSHKTIMRPTITHADKVMHAIADCVRAIKDINSSHGAKEMRQLVELTKQAIQQHPIIASMFNTSASTTAADPRVQASNTTSTQAVPRVHKTAPAQRQTRSMSQSSKHATRLITSAFFRTTEAHSNTSPPQQIP